MNDHERGPSMRPERDAAIRAMLIEHVRAAPEIKAVRRRRNWMLWSGAGVLAIGIGATAGAVVLQAAQVSNTRIVHCLSSDQRAADGSYPGSQATLASTDEQGRVHDAIELCTTMWQQGLFASGFDPTAMSNPPGEVPPVFQVCVMSDGSAAVVPSDEPAICSRLGLAPLED